MEESARITRDAKHLKDVKELKTTTYQALIIPSFLHQYDKRFVEEVYNLAVIRSIIKEFNIQKKIIVPIGPSAINLVGKSLGLQLRTSPLPNQKE